MKYLIEIFNKETGRRYHYDHVGDDLSAAVNQFNQTDEFTFSAENATIVTLSEINGHRNGCFNEGALLVSTNTYLTCERCGFSTKSIMYFFDKRNNQ